jgi:hypothetical protein
MSQVSKKIQKTLSEELNLFWEREIAEELTYWSENAI